MLTKKGAPEAMADRAVHRTETHARRRPSRPNEAASRKAGAGAAARERGRRRTAWALLRPVGVPA